MGTRLVSCLGLHGTLLSTASIQLEGRNSKTGIAAIPERSILIGFVDRNLGQMKSDMRIAETIEGDGPTPHHLRIRLQPGNVFHTARFPEQRDSVGYTESKRSKNERYFFKACRRSSVEASSPLSHCRSSPFRASAKLSAKRLIA